MPPSRWRLNNYPLRRRVQETLPASTHGAIGPIPIWRLNGVKRNLEEPSDKHAKLNKQGLAPEPKSESKALFVSSGAPAPLSSDQARAISEGPALATRAAYTRADHKFSNPFSDNQKPPLTKEITA